MPHASSISMKSYIQPFERILALRELDELLGKSGNPSVSNSEGIYNIPTSILPDAASKLVYWDRFGDKRYTNQAYREATSLVARNGSTLAELPELSKQFIESKIPRSRCLRYGPHGIHEYRGKFFPQLVKALINIAGVKEGSTIFDPMCGSGTTLVEAAASGHKAIGTDMNPLSVLISEVKCDALNFKPSDLIDSYDELQTKLVAKSSELIPRQRLPADDTYLQSWFAPHVLSELDGIASVLDSFDNQKIAKLFRVSLSNIVRQVSFQKVVDLRVRREDKVIATGEPTSLFLGEALRSAKAITAYVSHGGIMTSGSGKAVDGDARTFVKDGVVSPGSVDLIITSPPYATALPYLDTDRLSLSFLGLLSRSAHRSRDQEMIGNREINERIRREQWARFTTEAELLPESVNALIHRVENENCGGQVGFRRRNLGALLATYFLDMTTVLNQIQIALKPGALAFVVVGNNRTTTPLGEIEIDTSLFTLQIAEKLGFVGCERIEMEMLSSREIFKQNRTPSEHIVTMRRQK